MTQEDKKLLLKDLCARLPYRPICEYTDTEDDFCTATGPLGYSLCDFIAGKILIKPYLRSMSSMTKGEKDELFQLMGNGTDIQRIDFYLFHHFDYRGLIERGLALEAPKNMYGSNSKVD